MKKKPLPFLIICSVIICSVALALGARDSAMENALGIL
jgi:hypothetical protein